MARKRGRRVEHTEPFTKVTVALGHAQVASLDRLALDIRLRHGRVISRAGLLRALIEAAGRSGVDLTQASSAGELTVLLAALFRQR